MVMCVFFFKHKTAYEMRISDWSSDVCSSDLMDRLADLAEESGLSRGEAAAFLESNDGLADVLAETRFAYESGINGVPCFIFDRHYALAGAQEPEAFFPLFELDRKSTRLNSRH